MEEARKRSQKTILCVDDDKNTLASLCRALRPMKYTLLVANNGEDGLKLLEEEDIDLVLLDVMMPGMSGHTVMERMKELGKEDVPVVMVSGMKSGEDVIKGYEGGCICYVTKPYKSEYIANVVKYLIGELPEKEREELALKL